jgi:hypothetical protein
VNDDRTPETPEPDGRDERLAALLEVRRLDDVTRRRLVSRAVAQGPSAGARRRLERVPIAAAAALVALVVVGGGLALVLRDGDGAGTTTAAERTGGRTADSAVKEQVAAPVPIGDLGDVSDPDVLRRRLAADSGAARGESAEEHAAPADADAALPVDPACAAELEQAGAGSPSLLATGTDTSRSVVVLVAPRRGEQVAFVLDAETCDIRSEVPLA